MNNVDQIYIRIAAIEGELNKLKKDLKALDDDEKRSERIVVYGATRNIYEDMEIAAKSLLDHTIVDKVYFLTEDDVYPGYIPSIVEAINVSNQKFYYDKGPNYSTRWSYMALMKVALHRILGEHNKVLWLDCDTLVVNDISKIFDTDMENCYFGMVKETNMAIEKKYMYFRRESDIHTERGKSIITPIDYYNTGVMLCDLERLRWGMGDELVSLLNSEKLTYLEQDAINYICEGRICELPDEYNVAPFTNEVRIPRIFHLSYSKNESKKELKEMYRNMSWDWATRFQADSH